MRKIKTTNKRTHIIGMWCGLRNLWNYNMNYINYIYLVYVLENNIIILHMICTHNIAAPEPYYICSVYTVRVLIYN